MPERRKSPRYPINLRAYFPELKIWGHTTNISLDGCYIEVNTPISEGFLTDLLIEIPVIGTVALKGYVQHTGNKKPGMGLQFVQVRFAYEESDYYTIYSRFVKLMPRLEEIRGIYLDLVQKGLLKLLNMPEKKMETDKQGNIP